MQIGCSRITGKYLQLIGEKAQKGDGIGDILFAKRVLSV